VAQETEKRAWLRALGRADLPSEVEAGGEVFKHLRTFKHDFFAATGLYEGAGGEVIYKVSRRGLLGRWLARRELAHYERVHDLDGIPRALGSVGDLGFVHEFVPGHPLQRSEHVPDEFFTQLRALIETVHTRDTAYADLEKRENILVTDDGKPALIDFQISWHWPTSRFPAFFGRAVLKKLQAADLYHLQKHRRRHRPDQMTEAEIAASRRLPRAIRVMRALWWPVRTLRRAGLKLLTGKSHSPKQDGPEFVESVEEMRASREPE
jgi:hypothetical protein